MSKQNIHVYNPQEGGSLNHTTSYHEDIGGEITVAGDVVPLAGWPTPAMRRAVAGHGDEVAWYVGTDMDGNIIRI